VSVVTSATVQKGFVIVTDPGFASLTGTTSFITVTPSVLPDYSGRVDIVSGWSSDNAMSVTQTTVSHSGLFVQSFLPLYDGFILANINSVISGPKLGVNGITVSDSEGNSELFVGAGSLTWPVQANVPYTFTVSASNSRTGPNGLNVLMTADSSVEWVVVPEPGSCLLVAAAMLTFWLIVRAK
jgi:hypothetical protein